MNILIGKENYTTSDLIKFLEKFEPETKLNFATIDDKGCICHPQKENLIWKPYKRAINGSLALLILIK